MARGRTIEIRIDASNRASSVIERVVGSVRGLAGETGRAAPQIGRLGSILQIALGSAMGNMISGAISGIINVLRGFGRQAMEAVGHAQTLEIAVAGLLTESLMYQKVIDVQQKVISLTKKETQALADLTLRRNTLNARIQEQRERIRQLTEAYGAHGLNVKTAQARLAEMQNQRAKMTAQIDELATKEGQLVNVTRESYQQTMDFAEAQAIATDKAKALLEEMQKLAIVSPFETKQIEQIAQLGLMAGMSTEQVKEFTAAWLDYAATHGITSANLGFAADQFLQLAKIGKLTTVDLRQLRRMGIDVARILGVDLGLSTEELTERFGDLGKAGRDVFSGMTVEEFNRKVAKSPELMEILFQKFTVYAEQTTAGAAQKMAMTLSGMMSTAGDIIELGSRNLFRPIIEAISPAIGGVLDRLADLVTGGKLEQIGQQLGERLSAGLERMEASPVVKFFKLIAKTVSRFIRSIRAGTKPIWALRAALGALLPAGLAGGLTKIVEGLGKMLSVSRDLVTGALTVASDWFTQHGPEIADIGGRIAAAFGLVFGQVAQDGAAAQPILTTILTTILDLGLRAFEALAGVLEYVSQNWETFRTVIVAVGAALAGGAIAGAIGGVIAALAALISPITLIIAAVVALYLAWSENWFGIQDITNQVLGYIQGILGKVGEAVAPALEALKGFAGEIIVAFQAGGIAAAIERFKELWPGIREAIVAGLSGIWSVIGPILAEVGAGIWEAVSQWGISILENLGIIDAIGPLWESFKQIIGAVIDAIWPAIQGFVESVSGALGSFGPALESLKALWVSLQPVIKTVMVAIGAIVLAVVTVIVGIFNGLAAAIGPIIEGIASVINGLITIITGIVNTIVGVVELIWAALQGDPELIATAWEKIKTGLEQIVTGIVEVVVGALSGLWDAVKGFVVAFVEGVIGFAEDLYDRLVGGSIIPDMVKAVVKWFKSLPEEAAKAIVSGLKHLIAAGKEIVESLRAGIEKAWDSFVTWVKNKIEELVANVLAGLGIGSPSKPMLAAGANLVDSLRKGMESRFPSLANTVAGIGQVISRAAMTLPQLGISGGMPTVDMRRPGGLGAASVSTNHVGGDTYHVTINDPMTAALFTAQIESRRTARANAYMGA